MILVCSNNYQKLAAFTLHYIYVMISCPNTIIKCKLFLCVYVNVIERYTQLTMQAAHFNVDNGLLSVWLTLSPLLTTRENDNIPTLPARRWGRLK